MTPIHDPRPASRYPQVRPGAFAELLRMRRPAAAVRSAVAPGARLLRLVPAQVIRLELVSQA